MPLSVRLVRPVLFTATVGIAVVCAVLALAACTPGTIDGHGSTDRTTAASAAGPTVRTGLGRGVGPALAHRPVFAPLAGASADGQPQAVLGFAEAAGTVVAVGHDASDGVGRALLLWSRDDGRTWRRGAVAAGSDPATVGDSLDVVVVRHGRFLALGNESGGVAGWSSADGRHWVRRSLTGTAFTGATQVTGLTASAGGFVAVGQATPAGRRSTPLAWTSPDGRHWTPRGAGAGLVGVPGSDVSLSGVASSPAAVVAVGEIESGGRSRVRPRVWRSVDGGTTWRAVPLRDRLAGSGTRSFFGEVTWTGSHFTAVGSGGPGGPYAGVVVSSVDGSRWTAEAGTGALGRRTDVYLARAVGDAVFGVTCGGACTIYGAQRRSGTWRPVALPVTGEGGDMDLLGALRTSRGTTLLAGSADPHGDADARIWRAGPGGRFGTIRPVPPHGRPVVRVLDVATDGATDGAIHLAVGTSAGLPVTWRSGDGVHFAAPVALSGDRRVSVSGVEHGPRGWLLYGTETVGANEQALVWTSADTVHWRRSRAGTFGRAGPFAYSSVSAAVPYRGWTVVGERTTNGAAEASALAATSSRGGPWRRADESSSHLIGDKPPDITYEYDLDGRFSGNRGMLDVAVLGGGLVAVGNGRRAPFAATQSPAVWLSADAHVWHLAWLPLPAGAGSAQAQTVAVRGSTITVLGTRRTGDATAPVGWTSSDAGRSWTVTPLPGAGGTRHEIGLAGVLVTSRGFLALGSAGRPGSAMPIAWTSPDGRGWHRLALADPRLTTPGDWTVRGPVATRGGVRALAERTDTTGVRTIVFTQPG